MALRHLSIGESKLIGDGVGVAIGNGLTPVAQLPPHLRDRARRFGTQPQHHGKPRTPEHKHSAQQKQKHACLHVLGHMRKAQVRARW